MSARFLLVIAWVAASGFALAACGSESTAPREGEAVFVIDVVGEKFRILLRDEATIAQARRILRGEEEQKIVQGRLVAGDGGFNTGYSWHLEPESVAFVQAAIELCDGRPSFVEEELDYWLEKVKSYCPWGTRVVAEE